MRWVSTRSRRDGSPTDTQANTQSQSRSPRQGAADHCLKLWRKRCAAGVAFMLRELKSWTWCSLGEKGYRRNDIGKINFFVRKWKKVQFRMTLFVHGTSLSVFSLSTNHILQHALCSDVTYLAGMSTEFLDGDRFHDLYKENLHFLHAQTLVCFG